MKCTNSIYLELFRTLEHFHDLKNILIDIMKNKYNTSLKMLYMFIFCYFYVWKNWLLADKMNAYDKNGR